MILRTLNCTRSSCGPVGLPFWMPPQVPVKHLVASSFQNFQVPWIVFLTAAVTSLSLLKSFALQLSSFQVSLSISSNASIKFLSSCRRVSLQKSTNLQSQNRQNKAKLSIPIPSIVTSLPFVSGLFIASIVFPPKFLIRSTELSFSVFLKAQIYISFFKLLWQHSQLIGLRLTVSLPHEICLNLPVLKYLLQLKYACVRYAISCRHCPLFRLPKSLAITRHLCAKHILIYLY